MLNKLYNKLFFAVHRLNPRLWWLLVGERSIIRLSLDRPFVRKLR